jgi:hypothetical protein
MLYLSPVAIAQEYLTGLRSNTQIIKENQKQKSLSYKSKSENLPLTLPFFEDFSNYTGYPNEKYFADKQAFVNNTYPVFPPTIGVVTLDALNEYGEIYPHLNAISKGADTLTSRFIRMDSLFLADSTKLITLADNIYFSFYFQPGGGGIVNADAGEQVGNQPNKNDSLVLEFGYLDDSGEAVWEHIWSTPGFSINIWTLADSIQYFKDSIQYFKQVLIPITNDNYLCDNFRFRFRNYASLEPQQGITGWEGNVDQWHIDYIRLDVNRSDTDFYTNDLAFVSPTTSFLEKYQAMPWKQFRNTDMKDYFSNQLTNLNDTIIDNGKLTSRYQYIISKNGEKVNEYSSGAIDVWPYCKYGIHNNSNQASPKINYLPNNLTDSTTFIITHIFENESGKDIHPQNDTCVFEQKFLDYYAYDDGTAEYGYCLNNTFNIAYLAMKFSLNVSDHLSAVRMWFNHTKNSENEDAVFSIIVWKDTIIGDDISEPGRILYTLEGNKPAFSEQFLDFVEYQFDTLLLVSGNIWVGFEQQGNVQLNLGFDQNTDSRKFFRFNTRGDWETSAFKGTPMLRPVFGKTIKPKPNTNTPSNTILYPNPTKNDFQITSEELQVTKVEIYNTVGIKIDEQYCNNSTLKFNISTYPPGIFFVKIFKENSTVEVFKLVKM